MTRRGSHGLASSTSAAAPSLGFHPPLPPVRSACSISCGFTVTPATFRAHLDAVVASGREPITVSQLADGLSGRVQLPARPVLITVDDGFADFADNAMPALAERKLPSTLYVTTGALAGRPNESVIPPASMLRAADLPGLEAAGVEIGAHSHTHRQMDLLSEARKPTRLRAAATCSPRHWGIPRSFAYPHGYWRAEGAVARQRGWLRLSLHRRRGAVHGARPSAGSPAAYDPSRHGRVCGRRVARWFPCQDPAAAAQGPGLRLASVPPWRQHQLGPRSPGWPRHEARSSRVTVRPARRLSR